MSALSSETGVDRATFPAKYKDIRTKFFTKIKCKLQEFDTLSDQTKMQHLLSDIDAARYVSACHSQPTKQHIVHLITDHTVFLFTPSLNTFFFLSPLKCMS